MKDQNFYDLGRPAAAPAFRHTEPLCWYARIVVAGITLLCGCASYSPRPVDPFHELRQLEERVAGTRELDVVAAGNLEWFPLRASVDFTDGLDLPEANALALFHAPEVRSARSSERVAAAQLLRAGLLSNPELFLGPRISTEGGDVIFPAGLSWELPLWGKRGAEKDLADRQLSAAQIRVLATELRVLTEVRSTFIRVGGLNKTLRALEARLSGGERVLQWVAALRQAGEVDAVTAYLARLEQDDARAALTSTRLEIESTTRELFETIGVLPDAELPLVLDPDPASLPDLPSLSRKRLLLHPEIRAALAEYEAAEASLRLEVARQYPGIRVGPEFEDDRGEPTVGVGIGVELPLFDRNRAGIAGAEVHRAAARERLESSLLRLSHAEAQARAEWNVAERMLRDYRAGHLEGAEQAREALERQIETGQSDVLEVLAALQALTRGRVRELELERDSAIARLRAAVAGGAVLNDPTGSKSETEKR